MVRVAHIVLDSNAGYAADIQAGPHHLTADEPRTRGGTDAGPAPFQLLLAALAACTSITLRMYAERKGWTLGSLRLELEMFKEADQAPSKISRVITVGAPLDDVQRQRLAEIADKTPVTLTLKAGVAIETSVKPA
jgi:putative redox protein